VWFYTDAIINDLRQITRRTVQLQVEHFRTCSCRKDRIGTLPREMAKKDSRW
jgi:hypothetical protein